MTVEQLIAELQKIPDESIDVLDIAGWAIHGVKVKVHEEDDVFLNVKEGDIIAYILRECD